MITTSIHSHFANRSATRPTRYWPIVLIAVALTEAAHAPLTQHAGAATLVNGPLARASEKLPVPDPVDAAKPDMKAPPGPHFPDLEKLVRKDKPEEKKPYLAAALLPAVTIDPENRTPPNLDAPPATTPATTPLTAPVPPTWNDDQPINATTSSYPQLTTTDLLPSPGITGSPTNNSSDLGPGTIEVATGRPPTVQSSGTVVPSVPETGTTTSLLIVGSQLVKRRRRI